MFKIACIECGEESNVFATDGKFIYSNDNLNIRPDGYNGEITIECKECQNKIHDDNTR